MSDPLQEYQRLVRLYREMGDEELLELARQMDDLTKVAREVLGTEMSRRRLTIPAGIAPEAISTREVSPVQFGRFALLSATDCVWEFAENEDAQAAAEMLADAGIWCDVVLPGFERLDMGAPRIAVLPADADKARQLLLKPIPEEFRILVRTSNEFILQTCPQCGSADPLLESIEPTKGGTAKPADTFGSMS